MGTIDVIRRPGLAAMLAAVLLPALASASDVGFAGSVGAEVRAFPEPGRYPGQLGSVQASLQFEPEVSWQGKDWRMLVAPYLRVDGKDHRRTHADLRSAYWRWQAERISARVGWIKVFWGVAESRHLVDVINQRDMLEDLDGEDKLGQPAIELVYSAGWGDVTAWIMPYFREREFPGRSGRLRAPLPVVDEAAFSGRRTRLGQPDLAIRYSHYVGAWDVGVSAFHGTSREPRLLPTASGEALRPHYDAVSQLGLDLQFTKGAWLWKFEGLSRHTRFETHGAAVLGVEYTRYGILGSRADLGMLLEYQYDGRSKNPAIAPQVIEDNDVFLGARLALNDVRDTSVIAGAALDVEDGSRYGILEATRRIADAWTVDVEGRFVFSAGRGSPLDAIRKDSHLVLRINHHF